MRFNFDIPANFMVVVSWGLLFLLPAHAVACRIAGLYRGIWMFASLPDLKRVLRAVGLSTAALLVFFALYRFENQVVPRSLLMLYPMLMILYMGGGRAAYRMWKEHRLYGGLIAQGKPVVIVGAGRGGAMLVRELERSADWRVVCLVDDDRSKWGRELSGHPVVGGIDGLADVLASEKALHVILAMPSAAAETCRRATDIAVEAGAHVFTVPGLEDVMTGRVAISTIRPVEIEDLLGREPVWIDTQHVAAMVAGKTILVTGQVGPSVVSYVGNWRVFRRFNWFSTNRASLRFTRWNNGLQSICQRLPWWRWLEMSRMRRGWMKYLPPINPKWFSTLQHTSMCR